MKNFYNKYTIYKTLSHFLIIMTKNDALLTTRQEIEHEAALCRALFEKKTRDYGTPCPYGTGPAGNQGDREDERRR